MLEESMSCSYGPRNIGATAPTSAWLREAMEQ